MPRCVLLASLLIAALGLPGCGEAPDPGAREVPVARPREAPATPDPGAATKAPRAIATH